MVSRTDSSGNSVAAWNVRPSPRRARPATLSPATSSPSSTTDPLARTYPPMAFTSVDLPAPLVPISPTISPRRTSTLTSRTAWMPPKRTDTSVARNTTRPSAAGVGARAAGGTSTAATGGRGCPAGSGGSRPATQSSTQLRTP